MWLDLNNFIKNRVTAKSSHLTSCSATLLLLLHFMAALSNRAGHYIFVLWFLLSFFLSVSFLPRPFSAVADWMSTILPHIVGLSTNLGCRSEMCCMRLAAIQDAKVAKNSPSTHHRTTLSGYIFTTKAHIDNRKKLIKQQYLPHMSSQLHNMVNFGPLAAEIGSFVWAPQQISTGFASWLRYCSDVAQRKPTKLRRMFDRHLGWYTIFTFSEAVAPYHNFARCKIHFASKSGTVLYCQRYCTVLE